MPPKAKGKGKGKDGPAKFADKENLARAETEVLSLQRLLELQSYEVRTYFNTGSCHHHASPVIMLKALAYVLALVLSDCAVCAVHECHVHLPRGCWVNGLTE